MRYDNDDNNNSIIIDVCMYVCEYSKNRLTSSLVNTYLRCRVSMLLSSLQAAGKMPSQLSTLDPKINGTFVQPWVVIFCVTCYQTYYYQSSLYTSHI